MCIRSCYDSFPNGNSFGFDLFIIPNGRKKSNIPSLLCAACLVAADAAAGVGQQTVVRAAAAVLVAAAQEQLLKGLDAAEARALDAVAAHAQRVTERRDPPRMGNEDV